MPKAYKILIDGQSCNGGSLQWSLPTKRGRTWIPGDWHDVSGSLVVCAHGLHLATDPYQRWYRWGATVYRAEYDGECIDSGDKLVVRKARLLSVVPDPDWLRDAKEFVDKLGGLRWMNPDGKPLKKWKLFTSSTLDAAWSAAESAARSAAWSAARSAARFAAWSAAESAAMSAAESAARSAAWSAALMAECLIVSDRIDKRHLIHARDRMRVLEKGYCLLRDVDGVLYVYAEDKK